MRCFRAKKIVHKLDEYIRHGRCPFKEKIMIANARNLIYCEYILETKLSVHSYLGNCSVRYTRSLQET